MVQTARATSVQVTDETISVVLADGHVLTVPTAWYPRLQHATARERANYEIDRVGVIWPDIDADFSIQGILLGCKSGESAKSFQQWLEYRSRGEKVPVAEFPMPADLAEELEREEPRRA